MSLPHIIVTAVAGVVSVVILGVQLYRTRRQYQEYQEYQQEYQQGHQREYHREHQKPDYWHDLDHCTGCQREITDNLIRLSCGCKFHAGCIGPFRPCFQNDDALCPSCRMWVVVQGNVQQTRARASTSSSRVNQTRHQEEMKNICKICSEEMAEWGRFKTLQCKHKFHLRCIDNNATYKNDGRCPECEVMKNMCKICSEEMAEWGRFQTLQCKHKFHQRCIDNNATYKIGGRCPECDKMVDSPPRAPTSSSRVNQTRHQEQIKNRCEICSKDMSGEGTLKRLQCKHKFHQRCIDNNATYKDYERCPGKGCRKLCKVQVTQNKDKVRGHCLICCGEFTKGQTLELLPCECKFHEDCIDLVLETNGNLCPGCRRDVFE